MTAVPIPPHELKPNTWYYGVQCVCARLLAIGEDCFGGNGHEEHRSVVPLTVQCECGQAISAHVLHKFRTR